MTLFGKTSMRPIAAMKKWAAGKRVRIVVVAAGFFIALASTVVATTKKKSTMEMHFFTNTTFQFMLEIIPGKRVDPTGRRFWVARWPTNPKCAAGINFSVAGREMQFALLRWSWKEPNQWE